MKRSSFFTILGILAFVVAAVTVVIVFSDEIKGVLDKIANSACCKKKGMDDEPYTDYLDV